MVTEAGTPVRASDFCAASAAFLMKASCAAFFVAGFLAIDCLPFGVAGVYANRRSDNRQLHEQVARMSVSDMRGSLFTKSAFRSAHAGYDPASLRRRREPPKQSKA